MDPNLRSHPSVEHAAAYDSLTDADVEAAFEAVQPIAEKALGSAAQLLGLADPFEAEVHGAVVLSEILRLPLEDSRINVAALSALVGADGGPAARALLHSIAGPLAAPMNQYVTTEIDRLHEAGVAGPHWHYDLMKPLKGAAAWSCSPILESGGAPHSILVFEFARDGLEHGFIVYRNVTGERAIRTVDAIPNIGWQSLRKFLLLGEAFEVPYAIDEVDFERAIDYFDGPRTAMWNSLREHPDRFNADPDLATTPGTTLLLETHMTTAI